MRLAFALLLIAVLASLACGNVIARKYEYEEEIFLALDGSATVYVNASVPALVALRGVDAAARSDARGSIARSCAISTTRRSRSVASVTTSRREGRRYVHLRLDVPDIRRLGEAAPFAWSTYRYLEGDDTSSSRRTMQAAAGQDVGNVGWDGDELVAVRLHLPSKVTFHNSPSRKVERGNIVVWEQPLAERLKGTPLEVRGEDGKGVDPVSHPRPVWRDGRARGAHVHRGHLVCEDPASPQEPVALKPSARQSSVRLPRLHRFAHFRVRLQLVLQLELAEARRQRPRQHPLDVALHHAFERDAAAIDDDADRRVGHRRRNSRTTSGRRSPAQS